MAVDPTRAKAPFQTASNLDDPAQQAALPDRESAGDATPRANAATEPDPAQADLDATTAPDSANVGENPTVDHSSRSESAGVVIAGKYALLDLIGEGGMGSVWRAQQTEPVKRLVAVKLIKAGMDSRRVLNRFEAERQALAMMDHPNIARVFDGGLHNGRPFFVMELVEGEPITDHCDQRRLTPAQRLELFVGVCQAIQHAHQKGIIHRDLKPSNVLVASCDGRPAVKVIDFGVAKAIGGALTEETFDTGVGAVVGTLEYMSPEQASLDGLDIDTRSDVYSLGVLLYELLAGAPPFSRRELERKGLMEILRVVREDDPPRPSAKLSTADALPSISASRGVEPRKLTALLRDELDWVVMKALEKDRSRRYETANGLAADVLRYLAGEPVMAHPPNAAYRLRKFLHRNRTPVIAASLVLLALLAGMAGTTWGLVEARRQERLARAAAAAETAARAAEADQRRAAEAAAAAEKTANDQAQKRLAQVEKGNELLGSIFEDLNVKAVKQEAESLEVTLARRLLKAAEQLEGESIGDPRTVAPLQNQLGVSLLGLGHPKEAVGLLEKARQTFAALKGADDPDTLKAMGNLASAYETLGKLDLALPLFEETLKLRRARLGAHHPATLLTMSNLASAYNDAGKPDLALPLFEETLKLERANLGADDPETLRTMNNLAEIHLRLGRPDAALPLFEESVRLEKAKLGDDDIRALIGTNNLAWAYLRTGRAALATPLLEKILKPMTAKLGADHPDTLACMNNLAQAHQSAGRFDLALPLFEENLKLRKAKFGVNHLDTLISMDSLAGCYLDSGKPDVALPLFEEALKLHKANLGVDHPETLTCMNNLAETYLSLGKSDLALPLLEENLKLRKASLGVEHPDTLISMFHLAHAYRTVNRPESALPILEELLKLKTAKLGADHPDTLACMNNLVIIAAEAGRADEAVALLKDELAIAHDKLPPHVPTRAEVLAVAGLKLLKTGAFDEAEPVCRESLALRERDQPDDWRTFNVMSMLGGALLGRKKYADAEPPLLKGYEGMAARESTIPPVGRDRVAEALDRLIELYSVTDRPDEAAKYKDLRAKLPPPEGK